jgi:cold shock CspA family protein
METGTVIMWTDNGESAYGFVKPDAFGPNLYISWAVARASGCEYLTVGEKVEFTRAHNPNFQKKGHAGLFRGAVRPSGEVRGNDVVERLKVIA